MKKILASILLLLPVWLCQGQPSTVNIYTRFTDFGLNPQYVRQVILTPTQPFGWSGNTIFVPVPTRLVTGTNGDCTFSNQLSGYSYNLVFNLTLPYPPPMSMTNILNIPTNVTGNINATAYITNTTTTNFALNLAYLNGQNTFTASNNFTGGLYENGILVPTNGGGTNYYFGNGLQVTQGTNVAVSNIYMLNINGSATNLTVVQSNLFAGSTYNNNSDWNGFPSNYFAVVPGASYYVWLDGNQSDILYNGPDHDASSPFFGISTNFVAANPYVILVNQAGSVGSPVTSFLHLLLTTNMSSRNVFSTTIRNSGGLTNLGAASIGGLAAIGGILTVSGGSVTINNAVLTNGNYIIVGGLTQDSLQLLNRPLVGMIGSGASYVFRNNMNFHTTNGPVGSETLIQLEQDDARQGTYLEFVSAIFTNGGWNPSGAVDAAMGLSGNLYNRTLGIGDNNFNQVLFGGALNAPIDWCISTTARGGVGTQAPVYYMDSNSHDDFYVDYSGHGPNTNFSPRTPNYDFSLHVHNPTGLVEIPRTLDVGTVVVTNNLSASNITATTGFSGNGSGITSLTSGNLVGALPAISGAALTSLSGANITSGTVNSNAFDAPTKAQLALAGTSSGSGNYVTNAPSSATQIGTNAFIAALGGVGTNATFLFDAVNWGTNNVFGSLTSIHVMGFLGGNSNLYVAGNVSNCMIVGGYSNAIDGGSMGSVISGGESNYLGNSSLFNVISGGTFNRIVGAGNSITRKSAIVGGASNTVTGDYSTVIGGYGNTASGQTSVAAGANANAANDEVFVWSDGTSISAGTAKTFIVQAANGLGVNKTTPGSALDVNGTITASGSAIITNTLAVGTNNIGSTNQMVVTTPANAQALSVVTNGDVVINPLHGTTNNGPFYNSGTLTNGGNAQFNGTVATAGSVTVVGSVNLSGNSRQLAWTTTGDSLNDQSGLFFFSQNNVLVKGTAIVTNGIATGGNHTPVAVTVGASPWTFSNPGLNNLECYISGSVAYSVSKQGVSIYGSLVGDAYVLLQTNTFMTITYTVAPTVLTNSW